MRLLGEIEGAKRFDELNSIVTRGKLKVKSRIEKIETQQLRVV